MILVWGTADDPATAAILTELDRTAQPRTFLDQGRPVPTEWAFRFVPDGGGRIGGLDLAAVRAAFIRPHAQSAPSAGDGEGEAAVRFNRQLITWLETTPALVVNRLSSQASNMSKLLQLQIIGAHGFSTPESLATTDPQAARDFVARQGTVIYKSLSGIRSIVRKLPETELDRLDDVTACPTLFQAFVPGQDHRVHVVGDQVFATLIRSGADDYRYDRTAERVAVDLPREVSDRCVALSAGLGLAVSGIDLRRTPAGEWVCFEANPSPVFPYFDGDGRICGAIAELLVSGTAARAKSRH